MQTNAPCRRKCELTWVFANAERASMVTRSSKDVSRSIDPLLQGEEERGREVKAIPGLVALALTV